MSSKERISLIALNRCRLLLTGNRGLLLSHEERPLSSSGLGHSPLKAKTGVRVPLGVLLERRFRPLLESRALLRKAGSREPAFFYGQTNSCRSPYRPTPSGPPALHGDDAGRAT